MNVKNIIGFFTVCSFMLFLYQFYTYNKLQPIINSIYNRSLTSYKSKYNNAYNLGKVFSKSSILAKNLIEFEPYDSNAAANIKIQDRIDLLESKKNMLDSIVNIFWMKEGSYSRGTGLKGWMIRRNKLDNRFHYGFTEKKYYPELKKLLINGNEINYTVHGEYILPSTDTINIDFTTYYFDYFGEKDSIILSSQIISEQLITNNKI